MGTTAQKLQAIQSSKAAIKSAIEAKGVSDVGDVLADYATKIGQWRPKIRSQSARGIEQEECFLELVQRCDEHS